MKVNHIQTVDKTLELEIGYAGDMGPAALSDAIIEALKEVIDKAGVVYIKSHAPGVPLIAVDLFAHIPEPEDSEPPTLPAEDDEEVNL